MGPPPADGERTAPLPRRDRPLRILGASAVALTDAAVTFPWLGLVKTV